MLRLISILILLAVFVVVWAYAPEELKTNTRSLMEEGLARLRHPAANRERGAERSEGEKSASRPDEQSRASSETDDLVPNSSSKNFTDKGVAGEDYPEQDEISRRGRPKTEEFSDLYDQAKKSLFEAMKILEGRKDENP